MTKAEEALRAIVEYFGEPQPLSSSDGDLMRHWMNNYKALKEIAREALDDALEEPEDTPCDEDGSAATVKGSYVRIYRPEAPMTGDRILDSGVQLGLMWAMIQVASLRKDKALTALRDAADRIQRYQTG